MKKKLRSVFTGILSLGLIVSIGTTTTEASTSQESYKNKYNAPKGMVVKWYKTGWYTANIKGKTVFIKASDVKKYTSTTSKWVKKENSISKSYYKIDTNKKYNYNGYYVETESSPNIFTEYTIMANALIYKSKKDNDFLFAQDSKGNNVKAKTIHSINTILTLSYDDINKDKINNDIDKDGIPNIKDSDMDGDGIYNFGNYDSDYTEEYDIDGNGIDDTTEYGSNGFPLVVTSPWAENEYDNGLGFSVAKYVDYDKQNYTTTTYKTVRSAKTYTKIYVKPVPKNGITLAEYNKVKPGMTYAQVKAIIGEDGTLDYEYGYDGYTDQEYSWEQKGNYMGFANLSFENNVLISKSQYGLK
ncbi:hypothetical protein CN692_06985 [Bacillus sp. AFS002410]|uniref:hypothetical protein n=1 Tax=Bacillus sp. AFS002410 TaxID=2033481 RepID=UPI000BF157AC|nr:hypothetical protein [Bacillus sp. AFS002410]PEJ59217.1 hypothetical protein CN692_06985 [Bacillus sp. AFS002410]